MEDTTRYSRLKALKDYGYDVEWSDLRNKEVVVAGVGGIGSITVELLTRFGVGKIHVIDLDVVEEVNLNRLVFTEEHVGMSKTEAIKKIMKKVNPEVEIISHHADLMAFDFEDELEQIIKSSDLGFMCLDNIPARQHFNSAAVRLGLPYVDSGLLRSGLGGYVHLVIPRKTACYQCLTPQGLTNTNDATGLPCAASLPTTAAIIASLQTQIGIKYLLNFGSIPDYVTYNALTDHVDHFQTQRDPNCFVCGDKHA